MANSIMKDKQGPVWPLGQIIVTSPGTPVSIMSLVDPTNVNAPETSTAAGLASDEYTVRAQQIQFQGYKGSPAVNNTGNVYIIKKGGSGSLNRSDTGAIVTILGPGLTYVLASAPLNRNVFNAYEYFIDADNANDAAQVTLIIQ